GARTIKSEGDYRVSVLGGPDLRFYSGPISWDLGGAVGDPKTILDANSPPGTPPGGLSLKGLPVGHSTIALTKDGHARVSPTVKLGFWPFNYFGSLTATATFDTDNYHGANFSQMELKFDEIE